MVNVGLLGAVSVGKTTILRQFVKYIEEGRVPEVDPDINCSIVKTDFSGESTLKPGESKETKTIHPNRVVFREDNTMKNHTLFAPGGDRERAVVKMGIITISRIARKIIAVFDLTCDMDPQFKFFTDVRFFPKSIAVCLNKFDLLEPDQADAIVADYKEKIKDFFEKRRIEVTGFYPTCAETKEEFKPYNDAVVNMLLDITVRQP
jgi:GTPase SAR1 family protein